MNAFLQVTAATAARAEEGENSEKSSCMRAPGEWIRPWADADATADGGKRQSHQDGRGGELGGREAPRSAEVPLAAGSSRLERRAYKVRRGIAAVSLVA